MRTTRFLAFAFAFAFFVGARAAAADLPALRIVTPQYTLQCDTARMHAGTLELSCVPHKRAQPDAFDRFQYGTALPRALFAQYYGNGGPALCDGTAITCSTGVVTLNTANANTWSATQTFSGIVLSALSASDACVASDGSKNLIDGSCLTTAGGQTVTASDTFSGGASFGSPLGFSAVAMSAPSTAAVYSNASGDLILQSTTARLISLLNKLSAGSAGIGMNLANFSGLGHEGTNTACSGTGTFTSSSVSGDNACMITLASGAATMTFHSAYSVAPVCVATDTTAAAAVKAATTTTTLTLTGTSADVIAVRCIANGGI